jgi:excisionase family DNA binding protein
LGQLVSIHSCGLGRQPLVTTAALDGFPQDPPARALYPIKEAERILGVSRAHVYRLIGAGKLDARKIGNKTVITAASIEALITDLPAAKVRAA